MKLTVEGTPEEIAQLIEHLRLLAYKKPNQSALVEQTNPEQIAQQISDKFMKIWPTLAI